MPIQPPQWTEFLSCPVCYKKFNDAVELPISLGCGHTVCKACLLKLHQKTCPFDQNAISRSVEELPINLALLQLVGVAIPDEDSVSINSISDNYKFYESARRCITDLASHLKCLATGSGQLNTLLSRPMQRKLVTIINCQLVEEEGRVRAMRSGRSLGERTVTELILQHQNPAQLSTNLWAAIRARGCQFLGPAMQEEVLKLILLALEDGSPLSRKVLVLFVVQRLESQYPQASKTAIGHVVQLLYRASCFKVTKREEDSSLMQLKEEFRTYESLRREHDSQIVQIATEAGLRIAPEQWSSLLYGDTNHKSHMQSSIDKLQTPQSFSQSVNELVIALQRSSDLGNLARLRPHLELLANVDPSAEAPPPSWENLEAVLQAVRTVVQGLVDFLQFHSQIKPEIPQLHNTKYKTSLCRDLLQRGACPRGDNCTFAHSQDELERARGRNKKVGSKVNLIIPPIADTVVLDNHTREAQTNLSINDSGPPTEDDKGDHSEDIQSDRVVTVQTVTAPSITRTPGGIDSIHAPSLIPPAHLGGPVYPQPSGHIEYEVPTQLPPIPGLPPYPPTQPPYIPENIYYSQHGVPAYPPYLPDGSPSYPGVAPQTMGYPPNVTPSPHPYPPQYINVYDKCYPAPGPYGETWQTTAPPYYIGQDRGFPQPLTPTYTQPYPQRVPYPQQANSETLDDLHSRRKEILVHLNKETSPVTSGCGQHMMGVVPGGVLPGGVLPGGVPNIQHPPQPLYTAPNNFILPPRHLSSFHYNINQDEVSYELAKSVADTYATTFSTSTLAYSVDMDNGNNPQQKYSPWSSCGMTETTSEPVDCISTSTFCRESENGKIDSVFCPSSKFQTFTSSIITKHTNPMASIQTSKLSERDTELARSRSFSFLDEDFFIPFDPPVVSRWGPISRTAHQNLKSSDPVHVTAANDCFLVTPVTAVTRPYPISVQTPSRFGTDCTPPQLLSVTKTISNLLSMPRMSTSIVGVPVTTGQPYSPWNSYLKNSRAKTVQERLEHELAKVEHQIKVEEKSNRELSKQERLTCELKAIEQQISMPKIMSGLEKLGFSYNMPGACVFLDVCLEKKTGKTPNASLETSSSHRVASHLMSTSKIKPLRLGQVLDADIDLNAELTPEEQQELEKLHLSADLNKRDLDRDDQITPDSTTP